jgi:hypothetical protein
MKPGELNKLTIRQTLETVFGTEMIEDEFRFHPVRRWRFDYAVPVSYTHLRAHET